MLVKSKFGGCEVEDRFLRLVVRRIKYIFLGLREKNPTCNKTS